MKKYEIAALSKQELIDRLKELEDRLAAFTTMRKAIELTITSMNAEMITFGLQSSILMASS